MLESGAYIDKQVYRDGGTLDDVAAKYARVADITGGFRVPKQRIILWRGSDKDNPDAFTKALGEHADLMEVVTCSIHKEPVRGAQIIARMVQEVPDYGGDCLYRPFKRRRSCSFGRRRRAGHHRAGFVKEFPDDVWSSLRAPSLGAGDDGARAVECRACGAANPRRA